METKLSMKRHRNKFGRKTLLNPALCRMICNLLADANTIATVCAACGIDERSFYNWMERGEKESRGEFFQFFQSATRARATAKIKLVKLITVSAVKDWRAAGFLLERSWPEEYGRRAPDEIEALKKAQQPPPPRIKVIFQETPEVRERLAKQKQNGHGDDAKAPDRAQ